MRPSIGFGIFIAFWKEFVEFIKSEKSYTTVRSTPLKDVLVKGAGIGAVIGFYTFKKFWKMLWELKNKIGIYYGEICVPQKSSGQGG